MTIVGKILVFVNLVFSLVVGGLVMMVYMTRTNWEEVARRKDDQFRAVDADRKQRDEEYKALEAKTKADTDALQKQLDNLKENLKTVTAERDAVKKDLAAATADENKEGSKTTALQKALQSREQQVTELTKRNSEMQKEKVDLIEEKNEERKARIQADVEAKLFKSRNLELVSSMQDLQRELIRAKAGPNPAGAFVARKKGDENPPPDNVEGRVPPWTPRRAW